MLLFSTLFSFLITYQCNFVSSLFLHRRNNRHPRLLFASLDRLSESLHSAILLIFVTISSHLLI